MSPISGSTIVDVGPGSPPFCIHGSTEHPRSVHTVYCWVESTRCMTVGSVKQTQSLASHCPQGTRPQTNVQDATDTTDDPVWRLQPWQSHSQKVDGQSNEQVVESSPGSHAPSPH